MSSLVDPRLTAHTARAVIAATLVTAALSLRAAEPEDKLPPPEATEYWSPVPRVVDVPVGGVPADAIVLLDGKNLDAWESAKTPGEAAPWKLEDGAMVAVAKTGNVRTKQKFGDIQLHIEWRSPAQVVGSSQGRGNSGVFFMGRYELQVLDSHNNPTYVNGQAGSIYKQYPPLVNASRKPGEWQTYDVIWEAPRFNDDGTVKRPAFMTVFHNGVLIQNHMALMGPTQWRGTPEYKAHEATGPLELQDHGNPTAFRNIWVRELTPAK